VAALWPLGGKLHRPMVCPLVVSTADDAPLTSRSPAVCSFSEQTYLRRESAVLIEFEQNTMANMTAALEYVCKKIPADIDSHKTRKIIADAMMASAKARKRTLIHFQEAGFEALAKLTRPQKRVWPRLLRRRTRAS
jgi:hypothetical protein